MSAHAVLVKQVCTLAMWAGLLLMLVPPCIRALVPFSALPGWDLDPAVIPFAMAGIGPAGSIILDLLVGIGAGLMIGGLMATRCASRPPAWVGVCVLAGVAACLWHGYAPDHGQTDTWHLGNLRIGMNWASAMTAGLALCVAAGSSQWPRMRRIVLGVLLGLLVVLGAKGAHQTWVELPATIADFQANKQQVLAAHGWLPDSSMARSYERRLLQPDATAWFALSNIYASWMAAGCIALGALAVAALVARQRVAVAVLACAGLLCAIGLLASASRGGVIALLAGIVSVAALVLLRRLHDRRTLVVGRSPRMLAGCVGICAILGGILLVVIRGAMFTPSAAQPELSLLFRWFYMVGSLRIFGEHPLLGVGPDGFQAAYAIAKPPLSPEDVSSPHSVLFDWLACLGLAGVAWGAVLLAAAWRLGTSCVEHSVVATTSIPVRVADESASVIRRHPEAAAIVGIVTVCVFAAFRLNPESIPVWDTSLARPGSGVSDATLLLIVIIALVGIIALWSVVGSFVAGVVRRVPESSAVACGLPAACITLLAHAQIDMIATWHSSATLLALVIGACLPARVRAPSASVSSLRSRVAHVAALPHVILAHVPLLWVFVTLVAVAWEASLRENAVVAREFADVRTDLSRLGTAPTSMEAEQVIQRVQELHQRVYHGVNMPPRSMQEAMEDIELGVVSQQIGGTGLLPPMTSLSHTFKDQWQVWREATRLQLRHGMLLRSLSQRSGRDDPTAFQSLEQDLATYVPRVSGAAVWKASVHEQLAELTGNAEHLRQAREARLRSIELDPYSLNAAEGMYRLTRRLAEQPDATAEAKNESISWARRTLEVNELKRFDIEGAALTPEQRSDIEAWLDRQPTK